MGQRPRSDPNRHRVLLNEEVQVRAAVRPDYPGALLGVTPGQVVNLRLGDMFDLRGFVLEGMDMERDGDDYRFGGCRARHECRPHPHG
jgi:hypothetical protein